LGRYGCVCGEVAGRFTRNKLLGDLSQQGILPSDGYLNLDGLSTDAATALINERLAQQGAAAPSEETAKSLPWWRRRPLQLAVAATAALPLAWLLARAPVARWQLNQGDAAFRAYAQVPSEERLQEAGKAWQRARQLDPAQAAAHARVGFLVDFLNEPEAAESHWIEAIEREPADTTAARAYRTGLAHTLARLPARLPDAIRMYEADVLHPRSAIELAMLRWGSPSLLPRAARALNHPELTAALAGNGSRDEPPWGFTLPEGEVLLFLNRREQRCLLATVRATTTHLAGATPASPLASPDCQGIPDEVRDLLCHRLRQAATNPRAPLTARWLSCPVNTPAAASPPQASGTG
jgi:hypothetical protein